MYYRCRNSLRKIVRGDRISLCLLFHSQLPALLNLSVSFYGLVSIAHMNTIAHKQRGEGREEQKERKEYNANTHGRLPPS